MSRAAAQRAQPRSEPAETRPAALADPGPAIWRQWLACGSASTRVAYWKDVVCEAVLDVAMVPERAPDGRPFDGRIHSRSVAGARLVNFRSSGHHITRLAHQVDRSGDDCLMLSLQCEGQSRLEQRDGRCLLLPGDIGLLDSTRPFRITFPETVERRLVLLPRAWLGRRGLQARNAMPMRIEASRPTTPVIAQLLRTLTETGPTLDESSSRILLDALAELIARSALGTASPSTSAAEPAPARDGLERVRDHVARNLTSPTLSAAEAAAAAGVSLRTLHRLFARHGGTTPGFGAYVIAERLDFARRLLASGRAVSVSDAAFQAGFSDLSHFSRRFQARYGIRPSALRRRADSAIPLR